MKLKNKYSHYSIIALLIGSFIAIDIFLFQSLWMIDTYPRYLITTLIIGFGIFNLAILIYFFITESIGDILTVAVAYFFLLAGFAIGIEFIKPSKPHLNVPYIKNGTFGFRAWQSKVKIFNIKCFATDSLELYHGMNTLKLKEEQYWHCGYSIEQDDTTSICRFNGDTLILQNCASLFFDRSLEIKVFNNIKVDFDFIIETNADSITNQSSIQLLFNVDTNLIYNGEVMANMDLYYSLEKPFRKFAKLWIPAIMMEPANLYNSIWDQKELEYLNSGEIYKMSGIKYNDQIRIIMRKDDDPKLLYEGKIEK